MIDTGSDPPPCAHIPDLPRHRDGVPARLAMSDAACPSSATVVIDAPVDRVSEWVQPEAWSSSAPSIVSSRVIHRGRRSLVMEHVRVGAGPVSLELHSVLAFRTARWRDGSEVRFWLDHSIDGRIAVDEGLILVEATEAGTRVTAQKRLAFAPRSRLARLNVVLVPIVSYYLESQLLNLVHVANAHKMAEGARERLTGEKGSIIRLPRR